MGELSFFNLLKKLVVINKVKSLCLVQVFIEKMKIEKKKNGKKNEKRRKSNNLTTMPDGLR